MLNFEYSDGGKGERAEQRDCTVRAVAIVASIPYREAHTILRRAGRKDGRTFQFLSWACGYGAIADRLKLIFTAVHGGGRLTVNQFMLKNLKGRYIVRVNRHVFAVIDGVIKDTQAPGKKQPIRNIWRLEEKC